MVIDIIFLGIFLLIGFAILKIRKHTKKFKIISILLIGFLIYFFIVGLLSPNELSLDSPGEVFKSIYYYFAWIGKFSMKLWDVGSETTAMVGNAIKTNFRM
jgi:hypothetical protein